MNVGTLFLENDVNVNILVLRELNAMSEVSNENILEENIMIFLEWSTRVFVKVFG